MKSSFGFILMLALILSVPPVNGQSDPPMALPVQPPVALPVRPSGAPRTQAEAKSPSVTAGDQYILYPNDLIDVIVFQEDDLTAKVRVPQNGGVTLPLIGVVQVAGKTISEATRGIEAAYHDGYLVNPQVSITISEFSKRRFTVLGSVIAAGTYEFPVNSSLDLLQAVGMAGGFNRSASLARITVKRVEAGIEKTYKVNAKRDGAGSFQIQPNDVITVAESFF